MSGPVLWLQGPGGRRPVDAAELPLSLGGRGCEVELPGLAEGVVAYLGVAEGDPFVQPADGADAALSFNGRVLAASQWLEEGDLVEAGRGRLRLVRADGGLVLRVEARVLGRSPSLPVAEELDAEHNPAVEPLEYVPVAPSGAAARRRFRPLWALALVALAVLAGVGWLLFAARSVEVRVEPEPATLEIAGALIHLELAGRHLLLPGRYLLTAEREGYRTLSVPLEVGSEARQLHAFELERLPGVLGLSLVPPVTGARVRVDGEVVGATPLEPFELAAGEHRVSVSADGWLETGRSLTIEGGGREQTLELELSRDGAPVTLASEPSGARVTLDGEPLGRTPLTQGVASGRHVAELSLPGYRPRHLVLVVAPGEPLAPAPVVLEPTDSLLALTSEPPGASVTVDGEYRGETPLQLPLAPAREHMLRLVLLGHEPEELRVAVAADERRALEVPLTGRYGEVEVAGSPAGAEVLVDGEPAGRIGQTLRLLAVPHRIEVRAPGHLPYRAEVTPRPGLVRSLTAILQTPEEEAAAATPAELESAQGQRMILLPPGRFRVGAPRREPGRRSNEVEREVEITRPFYLGATEVTNRQFREFAPQHRSGAVGSVNLEIDHHPVVRVTWQQAAAYCNWLSEREGLPSTYVRGAGGELLPRSPGTPGYRLPTEAEWVWAARYRGGGASSGLRYPWGDDLPPPPGAGNYGDSSARAVLGGALPGYTDGHPGTAPVDGFRPTPPGLYGLGGNVAEWIQDRYGIPAPGSLERDPLGPGEGPYHVIRGAGWMDTLVTELRSSYRDYGDEARPDVGFRVARTAALSKSEEETP